ncbi:MAG: hypothetical protein QNJ31_08560, partial [Candidatus Caenarcaniphilales bacterium]|nr:hypothetical protein [Candidatus Caenarcaniphilales bacterium]
FRKFPTNGPCPFLTGNLLSTGLLFIFMIDFLSLLHTSLDRLNKTESSNNVIEIDQFIWGLAMKSFSVACFVVFAGSLMGYFEILDNWYLKDLFYLSWNPVSVSSIFV